ncbi:hypothetical protein HanPSC8_Chr12g0530561 [Helianthus annuus]|nr:hypothetical protein HanPSC8_Chr12g0530561 [Helianthus annuus]
MEVTFVSWLIDCCRSMPLDNLNYHSYSAKNCKYSCSKEGASATAVAEKKKIITGK